MQPSQDRLSLDAARQVDELCDQFESQWLAGKRTRIEDCVMSAPAPIRKALFLGLVAVELELLAKAGTPPTEAEYAGRFPAQAKLIAVVFKERAAKNAGGNESSISTSNQPTASFPSPDLAHQPTPRRASDATGKGPGIPVQIGRFEVIAVLGQGAFGRVYRARDPKLDRDVALKVPNPGAFATTQERERFLREARAAAAIQHPNICPVHDVVLDGDTLYIVMAYVAGKSLSAYLAERKNALTNKQVALIVRKLAVALQAAHARGIVHRDLKPANILFDSDRNDVVITDFGLARRVLADDVELTKEGMVMGTPAYMSPEQARGDSKDVGPAADIFSLGVILYEMLAGVRPFQGSMGEIIGKVQHVAPEPPSKLKPGIDPRLEKICLKALSKAPKDRFGSMREFAFRLGETLKSEATGAIAAGQPNVKAASGPSEAAQMAEIIAAMSIERKAESQRLERSHRGLSKIVLAVGGCLGLLMVLSICAVAGVGGWVSWNAGNAGPSVSVTLQNITHLHDNSVHYWLNDTKIDSKNLEGPLKLKIGEYKLVGKRGDEVVESRTFSVGPQDDQMAIMTAIVEEDLPEGPIQRMRNTAWTWNTTVDASPDGQWIIAGGPGMLTIWNAKTGKVLTAKAGPRVEKVAFSANGKNLYLAMWGNPPIVMEYDFEKPELWKDMRRFDGKIANNPYSPRSLEASRDGKRLLVGGAYEGGSIVRIWNLSDGKVHVDLPDAYLAVFSPDGKQVFTAAGGTDVLLHDINGEKPSVIQTYKGHTSGITCIACSPDGKIVAAGTTHPANAVRTWDVKTGNLLQTYLPHGNVVTSLHFSPDGSRLMTGGFDGILRISDVKTAREIEKTPAQGAQNYSNRLPCVVFSPGGRRAIFCVGGEYDGDGTVVVWQLKK